MDDVFHISTNSSEGLYKEKGSKFFSYLFPVKSIEHVEEKLEELKKLHPKSRHICYAYRLAPKDQQFRINDDGEPSGTAGKPIYNQILSAELYQTLVAVVRYFGGTKLGATGLIRAYKTAAEEVCKSTVKKETYETITCVLKFDYAIMGDLMNSVKQLNIDIVDTNFELNPSITILLREAIFSKQIDQIKASLLNRSLEDIDDDTEVEGLEFQN